MENVFYCKMNSWELVEIEAYLNVSMETILVEIPTEDMVVDDKFDNPMSLIIDHKLLLSNFYSQRG